MEAWPCEYDVARGNMKNHIEKKKTYKSYVCCTILAIFFLGLGMFWQEQHGSVGVCLLAWGSGAIFAIIACGAWWHTAHLCKRNSAQQPEKNSGFEAYL